MADKSTEKFFREMNIAFVIGDVDFLARHFADDIVWEMEGMDTLQGKEAFLAHVQEMDIKDDVKMTIDDIEVDGLGRTVSGKMTVTHDGGNIGTYSYRDVYQVSPNNDRLVIALVSVINEEQIE